MLISFEERKLKGILICKATSYPLLRGIIKDINQAEPKIILVLYSILFLANIIALCSHSSKGVFIWKKISRYAGCPSRRDIFSFLLTWYFLIPDKRDIFVIRLKPREKSYWLLIVNRDGCCKSKNHCSSNSCDNFITVFVDWPHVWVIAFLEKENDADWKQYYALFFTKMKLPLLQRKARKN